MRKVKAKSLVKEANPSQLKPLALDLTSASAVSNDAQQQALIFS